MARDEPYHHPQPDWAALWVACLHWAARPRRGLLLPMDERVRVARAVLRRLAHEVDPVPAVVELEGWLFRACAAEGTRGTAAARLGSGTPGLWHDPEINPHEPVLDLAALRERSPDGARRHAVWGVLWPILQRWAQRTIRAKVPGIAPDEAEDILSRAVAQLTAEPEGATTAMIDHLVVYEELEPLFSMMMARRIVDWIRQAHAKKRLLVSYVSEETLDLEDPAPLPGQGEITLQELAEQCRDSLSAPQWTVIFRLFGGTGATQQDLIADESLMTSLGAAMTTSAATRRRRLLEHVELALQGLRQCISSRFS
jgi:hypothetical protein